MKIYHVRKRRGKEVVWVSRWIVNTHNNPLTNKTVIQLRGINCSHTFTQGVLQGLDVPPWLDHERSWWIRGGWPSAMPGGFADSQCRVPETAFSPHSISSLLHLYPSHFPCIIHYMQFIPVLVDVDQHWSRSLGAGGFQPVCSALSSTWPGQTLFQCERS